MKKSISRETLLVYPNFSTDANKVQLKAVVSKYNKSIAFYGIKFNPEQVNYTTTRRELLFIVETLKELRKYSLTYVSK